MTPTPLSPSGSSIVGATAAAARGGSSAPKLVLAALAAAALLAAYSLHSRRAAGTRQQLDGTVRIALLSDTHVAGPEYPLGAAATKHSATLVASGASPYILQLSAHPPRRRERRAGQRLHHQDPAAAVPSRGSHQRGVAAPAGAPP